MIPRNGKTVPNNPNTGQWFDHAFPYNGDTLQRFEQLRKYKGYIRFSNGRKNALQTKCILYYYKVL